MLKIIKIALAVLSILSIALLYTSCEKRENPVELTINPGLEYTSTYNDTGSLWFNYMGNNTFRQISIYTPPGYVDSMTSELYPVLYLLHGFNGNEDYFTELYGLNHIADEMIADNEIEPMIIATIDASTILGGGWYTDTDSFGVQYGVVDTLYWNYTSFDSVGNPQDSSAVTDTSDITRYFAGLFERQIMVELRNRVESNFNVYTTRAKTGIGGHFMGGYGAMKLAMEYPDQFGSVSSMSGLLAFQGDSSTNFGAIDYIPHVLAENNIADSNTGAANMAIFYNMTGGRNKPYTSLMMSMASIFSPHDFNNNDTSCSVLLTKTAEGDYIRIDMPFHWSYINTGADTLISAVWAEWMEHDCLSIFSARVDSFTNVAVYMDCGDGDNYNIKEMNDIFSDSLDAHNIAHTYDVYSGYAGNPAGRDNFVQERLREVLKFHSQQFNQ